PRRSSPRCGRPGGSSGSVHAFRPTRSARCLASTRACWSSPPASGRSCRRPWRYPTPASCARVGPSSEGAADEEGGCAAWYRLASVAGRVKLLVFAAVLLVAVGCDHVTKHVARDVLADAAPLSLAAGGGRAARCAGAAGVRFELAYNPGGFLSLGVGLPTQLRGVFLVALVPLALLLVCALFLRSVVFAGRSVGGVG